MKTHSPFTPPNSYVVQVCNKTNVTPFKIVAKNEERGQPEASYVRSVKVELPGDTVVELHKGRRVLVWSFFLIRYFIWRGFEVTEVMGK